jgi:geranylgeranyl diphosphate synthase, type III
MPTATSSAHARPPSYSSGAPRISLDTGTEEFDLGYDPLTFEYKFPQPPSSTARRAEGDAENKSMAAAATGKPEGSWYTGDRASPADADGAPGRNSADTAHAPGRTSGSDGDRTSEGAPRLSTSIIAPSHIVNPATIPIRTSSSKAVNGEKRNGDSTATSPKKSPRKHKSLGAVPEERRYSTRVHPDERAWLSQGHRQTNGGHHPQPSSSSARDFSNKYAGSTFSQQPTLTAGASSSEPFRLTVGSDLINGNPSSNWSSEKENILKGPFDYLESHPGKDIRAQLINAFNAWLRVPPDSLKIITKVVAMLHTASLLVDDVEDSSSLRRGVPVAHHIFGAAQTINSANYVYFCALQELLRLNNPEAIQIYTDELLNLHRGQGMDLFWRDTLTCPSEDDYLEMVGNKTGGLFRLAIKLMCAESPSHNFTPHLSNHNSSGSGGSSSAGEKTDYVPLVNTIGLLFQILDDYRNLSDTTYTANKGLCEDLTEGKFSFPIIHSIRSDPSNLVLINILKQKTTNEEVKRYAMQYMEKTASFAYTRRVLRGLTKKALQLVDEVDERNAQAAGGGSAAGAALGKGEGVRQILERMRVDRQARVSGSGAPS